MTEQNNVFECVSPEIRAYPDDMAFWPGPARTAACNARDKLLDQHPGQQVVFERSYCMGKDDPRFPVVTDPRNWSHMLVYEVTISPPLRAIA